jgi:hypothetical protein
VDGQYSAGTPQGLRARANFTVLSIAGIWSYVIFVKYRDVLGYLYLPCRYTKAATGMYVALEPL